MIRFSIKYFFPAVVFCVSLGAEAEIHKCVVNGETIYQGDPCPVAQVNRNDSQVKHGRNPGDSRAAEGSGAFDWKFGSTIDEMKWQARMRQLPMSPGTTTYVPRYSEAIINRDTAARIYRYRTNLFDKNATVMLFYTSSSMRLYKIGVHFNLVQIKQDERKYFYESLHTSLTEKYGKARNVAIEHNSGNQGLLGTLSSMVASKMMEGLTGSLLVWEMDSDSSVAMNYKESYQLMQYLDLTYRNTLLEAVNDDEINAQIRRETDRAIKRDSDKL